MIWYLIILLLPVGIHEESDYGLGKMFARADDLDIVPRKPITTPKDLRGFPANHDFTPPTDRLGDKINAQLKAELEGKNVKPIIVVKNQAEVIRMAKASGRPVMRWTFWPDVYTATAEYFEELSEVQHVLIENPWHDAGEYILIDDNNNYIKAHTIKGAACAAKIRRYWEKEAAKTVDGSNNQWIMDGDPARLTRPERDAVLATMIRATMPNGKIVAMSVREAVEQGGRITADVCRHAGFNSDEAAYAVALGGATDAGSYASPTGRASNPYAAQGRAQVRVMQSPSVPAYDTPQYIPPPRQPVRPQNGFRPQVPQRGG